MEMNMERCSWLKSVFIFLFLALCTLALSACGGPAATATIYLPPSPVNAPLPITPTPTDLILPFPTSTPTCSDNLKYLEDITIPDGTIVSPGSALDKQWRVQNNGTCNWDGRYRVRLISGEAMGAASEQALYPARPGMEAIVRILFTAPLEAGAYFSEWQAYDPQGEAFGETFFIKVTVQP
jgi:hypothetical protein